MLASERYECSNPPCLHVVVDFSRRFFAVFLETSGGELVYIPLERLEKAYNTVRALLSARFREARGDEIDYLAYEKLGAVEVSEEE